MANWNSAYDPSSGAGRNISLIEGDLAEESGPGNAGVGLFFVEEDGVTFVNQVTGGSAAANGQVKPGDVIVSVDGHNVVGQHLGLLRSLIRGEAGTYVDLRFRRGDNFFNVSLMRGDKADGSDELVRLRRDVASLQDEISRLRAALRSLESQSQVDKQELEQLREALRLCDEQLRNLRLEHKEEQHRHHDLKVNQLHPLQLQVEQDKIDLERLRKLLRQAEDQLRNAHASQDDAHRKYRDLLEKAKIDDARRVEAEAREKRVVGDLQARLEEERAHREKVEHRVRQLEQERIDFEKHIRDEINAKMLAVQQREEADQRLVVSEDKRSRLQADNQRLAEQIRHVEAQCQGLEVAIQRLEDKNTQAALELRRVEELAAVRQSQLEDAMYKMDDERKRFTSALAKEQEAHANEAMRNKEREMSLQGEIQQLLNEIRGLKRQQEEMGRQMEMELVRLDQERKAMQASYRIQEGNLADLKSRLEVSVEQQRSMETELRAAREGVHEAEVRIRSVEEDKAHVVNRVLVLDQELQRQREKHQELIYVSEQLRQTLDSERLKFEEALRTQESRRHNAEAAQVHAEEQLLRAQQEINRLQEMERTRVLREEDYRRRHDATSSKFKELVQAHESLKYAIDGIRPENGIVRPHFAALPPPDYALQSSVSQSFSGPRYISALDDRRPFLYDN